MSVGCAMKCKYRELYRSNLVILIEEMELEEHLGMKYRRVYISILLSRRRFEVKSGKFLRISSSNDCEVVHIDILFISRGQGIKEAISIFALTGDRTHPNLDSDHNSFLVLQLNFKTI